MLPTDSLILVSGLPGAGKSLYAVNLAYKFAAEGVRVFSWGLDGASSELFDVLPDDWQFSDWKELPSGSVVIFDEAHKLLPVRTRDAPPKAIQDLTEIRHFGLRFIFITQDPRNIDAFVRRLIGRHYHLTRKMGFKSAYVKEWDKCQDDPSDFHAAKVAITSIFSYPKKLFSLYKSSTMHLVKRRIPFKVVLYSSILLVVLSFVGYVFYKYSSRVSDGEIIPGTSSVSSSVSSDPTLSQKPIVIDTLKDYLVATTPLSPVLPWTAPIYKEVRKIEHLPSKLVCYIGSKGCRCFTDQMTRVVLPESVCVSMVKDGVYDPYSSPYQSPDTSGGFSAGVGGGGLGERSAAPPPPPSSTSAVIGSVSTVPPSSGAFDVASPQESGG